MIQGNDSQKLFNGAIWNGYLLQFCLQFCLQFILSILIFYKRNNHII